MRAKKDERKLAEMLRRERGLSYKEIAGITGVSKSTLSSWLRDIPVSAEGRARLQERMRANQATFAARSWPINRARHREARERAFKGGAQAACRISRSIELRELALSMLYLGDGSKSGGRVQLASTNPAILGYLLNELLSLYAIDKHRLTFRLNLVERARSSDKQFKQWWKDALGYPEARFIKSQFDTKGKVHELDESYHGVCTLTYADTHLQQRLLGLAYTFIQQK